MSEETHSIVSSQSVVSLINNRFIRSRFLLCQNFKITLRLTEEKEKGRDFLTCYSLLDQIGHSFSMTKCQIIIPRSLTDAQFVKLVSTLNNIYHVSEKRPQRSTVSVWNDLRALVSYKRRPREATERSRSSTAWPVGKVNRYHERIISPRGQTVSCIARSNRANRSAARVYQRHTRF